MTTRPTTRAVTRSTTRSGTGFGSNNGVAGFPSNALGIYFASEYDSVRKAIPNKVVGGTIPPIYTRNPRGMFVTGAYVSDGQVGGWFSNGATITPKYAPGMNNQAGFGTRVEFSGTTLGLVYRQSFGGGMLLPAGDYVMLFSGKLNSGTTQDIRTSYDGLVTYQTNTLTTAWQQLEYPFTLAVPTLVDLRFFFPVGGTADMIIDLSLLWAGNSASIPSTVNLGGHLYLANSEAASISCTGGELALTNAQQATLDFDAVSNSEEATLLICVKRTGDYWAPGDVTLTNGRQPFLYTPIESEGATSLTTGLGIGEIDNEGYLTATHGSSRSARPYGLALTPTGTSPNLFDDGDYHVLSATSKDGVISTWVDDCGLILNPGLSAAPALNWWHMSMGGIGGLGRHKVSSVGLYGRALTGSERHTAIAAMRAEAIANGLTATLPKNCILFLGDSIMQGPDSNSFAQQFIANSTATEFSIYNIEAIPGSMLSQNGISYLNLVTRTPYHLKGIPNDLTGRRHISVFLFAANDLAAYDPDDYLEEYYSITDQYRAKGSIVVLCTPLEQGPAHTGYAAFNTKRDAMIARLITDEGTRYDHLINFDNTSFNPAVVGSGGDTSDGLHPVAAAHASKLEPEGRSVINPLLL